MPVIKIKELPVKEFKDINLTDIMVIEDTVDTYQITVEDLKLLFSSDEKMQQIYESLSGKFNNLADELAKLSTHVDDEYERLDTKYNNLFEDHERTKEILGKVREDLVDAQNDIIEINKHLDLVDSEIKELQNASADHENRIVALEKDNATNKANIKALQTDNEKNKKDIAKLQEDLTALTNKVDTEVDRLDTAITDTNTENHQYTNDAYDKIMKYIDYYHHIHTNPPNFDEPYKGDPIVASYIHPVGSIFETTDPEFEINKWFPGTWKFCGIGAAMDADGNRVVDYYTYIRVL